MTTPNAYGVHTDDPRFTVEAPAHARTYASVTVGHVARGYFAAVDYGFTDGSSSAPCVEPFGPLLACPVDAERRAWVDLVRRIEHRLARWSHAHGGRRSLRALLDAVRDRIAVMSQPSLF